MRNIYYIVVSYTKIFPPTRPWKPIRLWDIKDPTMYRQSAHRWRKGCQPHAPAALYPQKHCFSAPGTHFCEELIEPHLQFSNLLCKNVTVKTCKTTILAVVLYGWETWCLTLREEHRPRVLRRIFGPKRDEVTGEWKTRSSRSYTNDKGSCFVPYEVRTECIRSSFFSPPFFFRRT
jgi:hypothetical protein